MKFWNWGPTTIWHKIKGKHVFFSRRKVPCCLLYLAIKLKTLTPFLPSYCYSRAKTLCPWPPSCLATWLKALSKSTILSHHVAEGSERVHYLISHVTKVAERVHHPISPRGWRLWESPSSYLTTWLKTLRESAILSHHVAKDSERVRHPISPRG